MNNPLILKPFHDESGVSISESVTIDGVPYFTTRAIGEWLGYGQSRKAVNKIIERNPHINNPEWSVDVKLTSTDGKKYLTKAYNPVGLHWKRRHLGNMHGWNGGLTRWLIGTPYG